MIPEDARHDSDIDWIHMAIVTLTWEIAQTSTSPGTRHTNSFWAHNDNDNGIDDDKEDDDVDDNDHEPHQVIAHVPIGTRPVVSRIFPIYTPIHPITLNDYTELQAASSYIG